MKLQSFDDCFGNSTALAEFAKEHRSTVGKIFEGIKEFLTKIINLDLFVQTTFINKKGSIATPIGEQAPINTPKANSGTASKVSIHQNDTKSQVETRQFQKKPAAEIDREYLSLAKDPVKNEARLREMVREAARTAENKNAPGEGVSIIYILRNMIVTNICHIQLA